FAVMATSGCWGLVSKSKPRSIPDEPSVLLFCRQKRRSDIPEGATGRSKRNASVQADKYAQILLFGSVHGNLGLATLCGYTYCYTRFLLANFHIERIGLVDLPPGTDS